MSMQHKECPVCGKPLTEIPGKAIKCSANEKDGTGCNFILWINYNSHQCTPEEFDKLLDGEKIIVECIGKASGKKYKREIYLNDKYEIAFDEPFIKGDVKGNFL